MIRRAAILTVVAVLGVAALVVGINAWQEYLAEPTLRVGLGAISQVIVATGRVEPVTEVIIANKIPGRVKSVLVREGDFVSIGQPLLRFDDEEYTTQVSMARTRVAAAEAEVERARRGVDTAQAQWVEAKSGARPQEVARAEAEVTEAEQRWRNAEAERRRLKRLVDDGLIARSQYDAGETEAEVARARVRAAEQGLSLVVAGPKAETVDAMWAKVRETEAALTRAEKQVIQSQAELEHALAVQRTTVVEATVNGKVVKRLVEPGEAVDIGIRLMVLGDVHRTIVKAEVDETDVGKLAAGLSASITADAYPGRVFPGRVMEVGQAVGKRKVRPEDPVKIQDMKVLETKIEVVEGGADLKLGMTVDVKIIVAQKSDVPVLPKYLVSPGASEVRLSVRGPNGTEARRVRLGVSGDSSVEVLQGLQVGDLVLLPRRRP